MWYSAVGFVVTLTLSLLVAPRTAEAQQATQVYRIGRLSSGSPTEPNPPLEAFRQGLRELGYIEGQNLVIADRYAEDGDDRLADLAAQLVRLQVDVLVTVSAPATHAARHATSTIPIVFAPVNDPVEQGIVASLARPGGNVTGVSTLSSALSQKRLELFTEAIPGIRRVAVLWNAANPGMALQFRAMQDAARVLGLMLHSLEVRNPDDVDHAMAAASAARVEGLIVLPLPVRYAMQVMHFAATHRLPAIYAERNHVQAGGLMSYGPNYRDIYRRAAVYVDKILKGATPADLPVETPWKFELIINLKTAQTLDLTISPTFLFQADEVIK
jgi:putative ABC transport system substrate-binding protein